MNPDALRVERLVNAEAMASLRQSWNALAGRVPFRTHEWLDSWWQAYGRRPNQELLVLAVLDDSDHLVGLAPWYLERLPTRKVIQFLGSGEVCSDYLAVLAMGGCERQVALALADWLSGDARCAAGAPLAWDHIELGSVYEDDKTMRPLVAELTARGALVHRRERPSCWRVQLPDTWNEYLSTLSKSHRKQLRRLDRNYLQSGRAHLRVATNHEEMERGLDVLASLHQRRRISLGERGRFASPRFIDFHRQSAERLLHAGNLLLAWLEIDERIVAAEYQVIGDGVVYAYQSGIEPEALEHEPGRLITMALLKRAIDDGQHAFDFLRGDESYKAHWRASPRPTHDIRVVANTTRARWHHGLLVAGGNVKHWINKTLAGTGLAKAGAL